MTRPIEFDVNTPSGSASPRDGDNEIRRVKEFTRNAYRDLTEATGTNVQHTNLYGSVITADTNFVGDLTGNADSATQLEFARSITLEGDIAGTFSFDGTSDVTIPTTIQADSVALGTDTTGNYVGTVVGTDNEVTVTGGTGEGTDITVGLPDTIEVDLTGDVTGNLTGDVTGNADTATALETARNIGGVSFDGTADITLPGVNAEGNQDTTGNAGTATALETARTIGGVSFDGTANINLPGVNATGNQNTTGNAATASAFDGNRTITFQAPAGQPGATGSLTWDGAGNATTTLALTGTTVPGNVATADRWSNSRTISLGGDVTGSVGIDGSQNVTITTALAANSVGATEISSNSVGASELNVSGNGGNGQFLRSDGDGTFTWATPANTTYSAGNGVTLSGTTFSADAHTGISVGSSGISVNYGTTAGTAAQGNDSRLSNSRTCNNTFDNAGTSRTNLGLGGLATLSSVNAATIADGSVGAAELNVSGNGNTSQFLRSDGDGTFSWATPVSQTYTAASNGGLSVSSNAFSIATNGVTTTRIMNGAVNADKLATSAVTTSKIADSNVTPVKLSGTSPGNGEVLSFNSTSGDFAWVQQAQGSGNIVNVNQTPPNISGGAINSGSFAINIPSGVAAWTIEVDESSATAAGAGASEVVTYEGSGGAGAAIAVNSRSGATGVIFTTPAQTIDFGGATRVVLNHSGWQISSAQLNSGTAQYVVEISFDNGSTYNSLGSAQINNSPGTRVAAAVSNSIVTIPTGARSVIVRGRLTSSNFVGSPTLGAFSFTVQPLTPYTF